MDTVIEIRSNSSDPRLLQPSPSVLTNLPPPALGRARSSGAAEGERDQGIEYFQEVVQFDATKISNPGSRTMRHIDDNRRIFVEKLLDFRGKFSVVSRTHNRFYLLKRFLTVYTKVDSNLVHSCPVL